MKVKAKNKLKDYKYKCVSAATYNTQFYGSASIRVKKNVVIRNVVDFAQNASKSNMTWEMVSTCSCNNRYRIYLAFSETLEVESLESVSRPRAWGQVTLARYWRFLERSIKREPNSKRITEQKHVDTGESIQTS